VFDQKKRYAIIGLARSGIAAAYKIKDLGGKCFLSDMKPESEIPDAGRLKADFDCEFGQHSDVLLSCEEWIVSPGIPLTAPVIKLGREHKIKMISELEFGFQIKAEDSKIIAVTGSNGKSTTASLIAHIINQSGKKCILAGNIGDAFCGFPIEKRGIDFIVLEVSSFQLDLIDTFKPEIALLLNVTPDHLNRYDSFNDYALSKFNIFRNQNENDHAVLNFDDEVIRLHLESALSQKHFFTLRSDVYDANEPEAWMSEQKIVFRNKLELPVDNLQIKGPHNWANAMAAVLACRCAAIPDDDINRGIKSFTPLRHRLQYIAEVNGVSFYNDSKATNTDSVRYALLSFDQPIRIIMGGSDKGEDFSVLTPLLMQKAEKVYITGATSEQMRFAWEGHFPLAIVANFEDCIRTAFREASKGDVIVLSPACASYDKFRNFEHRGDTFINIVMKLVEEYEKK